MRAAIAARDSRRAYVATAVGVSLAGLAATASAGATEEGPCFIRRLERTDDQHSLQGKVGLKIGLDRDSRRAGCRTGCGRSSKSNYGCQQNAAQEQRSQ